MSELKEGMYQQGDYVGVEGGNLSYASQAVFQPPTRLYHFLMIDRYIAREHDYEIHEAIASGVRSGRLSWYKDVLYVVFRPLSNFGGDEFVATLGAEACELTSDFGRWGYDFMMYYYFLHDVPLIFLRNLIKERRCRRIRPDELPYRENHAVICTEFVANIWRQSAGTLVNIIPRGVTAIPAGYIEALEDRRAKIVGANIPAYRLNLNVEKIPCYLAVAVMEAREKTSGAR